MEFNDSLATIPPMLISIKNLMIIVGVPIVVLAEV